MFSGEIKDIDGQMALFEQIAKRAQQVNLSHYYEPREKFQKFEGVKYLILHSDNFKINEVLTESSQAIVFIGKYVNFENLIDQDKIIIEKKSKVVLKQFNLLTDRNGFLQEFEVLKKIKQLGIQNNGRFPVIISAKVSKTQGEILMTFSGNNIEYEFDLGSSFRDSYHQRLFTLKQLSDIGIQLTSQFEILHKLGYTHGDIKLQNICFDRHTDSYTLIDFALAIKIFHRNGTHKTQKRAMGFTGNTFFASESMVNLMSTSRKDDLESLLQLLCYLYSGSLPVI